jgi:hypothetical protein
MITLREKLTQAIDSAINNPTRKQPDGYFFGWESVALTDAVLATLTTEASEGNLPPELLAAVDQGREVAAARRLAMGDAK